jgi:hypothetical protein
MTIDEFLRQYAKHSGISEAEALAIKPDKFGDSPELADNLLALVCGNGNMRMNKFHMPG